MIYFNMLIVILCGIILGLEPALADEAYTIVVKNHEFVPKEIKVPTHKNFTLIIKNTDPSPMEFESFELNREKIIGPTSDMTFFLGPLDKGTYDFFDDFHHEITQGKLIAE